MVIDFLMKHFSKITISVGILIIWSFLVTLGVIPPVVKWFEI